MQSNTDTISLKILLENLLAHINPGYGDSFGNRPNIGFMSLAPEAELWSFKSTLKGYILVEGIRNADWILQAELEVFVTLLGDPQSGQDRSKALAQVSILPNDCFKAIPRFLAACGIKAGAPFPDCHRFPFPVRPLVAENQFRLQTYEPTPLPEHDPARLPALVAEDHPTWVEMYQYAWRVAFENLRQPPPKSGLIANFIDTAYNDNTFMWDSCFMTMFGRYARRTFSFMGTLDNFYAKQHTDGFICREIHTYQGYDLFAPQDPRSTGPNSMAWTEWVDYQSSRDKARLQAVFPALVAYYQWWRTWRRWRDGSYFTCGWGSLDNQTRVPDSVWHHRYYTWIDANILQALSGQILLKIGKVIDRADFRDEIRTEYEFLRTYINMHMWDEVAGFYFDRAPDGHLSQVKSILVYWGLLAEDLFPPERAMRIIAHLDDPALFKRPHRVPSQAADSEGYNRYGNYWLGGVWSPTNYVVLRGLTVWNQHDLAYEIALNHVENVAEIFNKTGTLWENYAPEVIAPGQPAKANFVGWTGLSAITIPLEYLIGLRPQADNQTLHWDIRLVERHGVKRYPLGDLTIDLICERRPDRQAPPEITVVTDGDFTLRIDWASGEHTRQFTAGIHRLAL